MKNLINSSSTRKIISGIMGIILGIIPVIIGGIVDDINERNGREPSVTFGKVAFTLIGTTIAAVAGILHASHEFAEAIRLRCEEESPY